MAPADENCPGGALTFARTRRGLVTFTAPPILLVFRNCRNTLGEGQADGIVFVHRDMTAIAWDNVGHAEMIRQFPVQVGDGHRAAFKSFDFIRNHEACRSAMPCLIIQRIFQRKRPAFGLFGKFAENVMQRFAVGQIEANVNLDVRFGRC